MVGCSCHIVGLGHTTWWSCMSDICWVMMDLEESNAIIFTVEGGFIAGRFQFS